jgi:hypothetical protein
MGAPAPSGVNCKGVTGAGWAGLTEGGWAGLTEAGWAGLTEAGYNRRRLKPAAFPLRGQLGQPTID